MEKSTHLVFLPSPGFGHLVSTVEMAKVLVDRDHRLSITVLVMKLPSQSKNSSYAANGPVDRIQFIDIPHDESLPECLADPSVNFMTALMDYHKPAVRKAISELTAESTQLAGIVFDMFCTPMIDIADEFGIPTYAYFTSSASFLGLVLHLQKLHDEDHRVLSEFTELRVPSFVNPFPVKLLPHGIVDNTAGRFNVFLNMGRGLRKVKGIMVNTLMELESHAIGSIASKNTAPPIYPVGPILTLDGSNKSHEESDAIISWLDDQPPSSVLFLCFGSLGGFEGDQVREIARALENRGKRFLWALRRPPQKGTLGVASNDEDTTETLPEGFLETTSKIGKVIGWAPQTVVLAHPAVGGFVSHCGWNSTLESLWYGVPVAAWPMYAEQQMNAFHLLKELGIAVEIKMDYKMSSIGGNEIVTAEEIEKAIAQLMDIDEDGGRLQLIKQKVKEMSEKCRLASKKDGSSYNSIGSFIRDVVGDTY